MADMSTQQDISVLIVAYCRFENLADILGVIENSNVRSVYISIDAPANQSPQTIKANKLVVEVAQNFKETSKKDVHLYIRNKNVGCSAAVLSSCDWFFQKESFGMILEDDCLPSSQFFDFVSEYREALNSKQSLWLISGSQFAPQAIAGSVGNLSNYAFIWGWATTSEKWSQMRALFLGDSKIEVRKLRGVNDYIESVYWYSGYRRAMRGFVDAWDTPLLYFMHRLGKQAILPPVNLVTNKGDDVVAVHTRQRNPLLRVPLGIYAHSSGGFLENKELDSWIRTNIYNISPKHLITNKITYLLDICFVSRRKFKPITLRLDEAHI
jgi:hypothetical protein